MRVSKEVNHDKEVTGFILYLSSNDTYNWANKQGGKWPGSYLAGERIAVYVDACGMYYLTINGKDGRDVPSLELTAIVADLLPVGCQHLWN